MDNSFVKVAVKPMVKAQIDVLASIERTHKYDLVGDLVRAAWQTAKDAGMVTDAMLQNATVNDLPHPVDGKALPVVSVSQTQS